MKHPFSLKSGKRKKFRSEEIHPNHRLYIRHKPGIDWNTDDDLPDFTQIKIDNGQSCNWNKLSVNHWVRFNDRGTYLDEYAVVSYKVESICNTEIEGYENGTLKVCHKPIALNYSHCELESSISLSKSQRRDLRLLVKRNANVELKPKEMPKNRCELFNNIKVIIFYFAMYFKSICIYKILSKTNYTR